MPIPEFVLTQVLAFIGADDKDAQIYRLVRRASSMMEHILNVIVVGQSNMLKRFLTEQSVHYFLVNVHNSFEVCLGDVVDRFYELQTLAEINRGWQAAVGKRIKNELRMMNCQIKRIFIISKPKLKHWMTYFAHLHNVSLELHDKEKLMFCDVILDHLCAYMNWRRHIAMLCALHQEQHFSHLQRIDQMNLVQKFAFLDAHFCR